MSSRGECDHHIGCLSSSSSTCIFMCLYVEDFPCTSTCGRASVYALLRVPIYALRIKNSKTNLCATMCCCKITLRSVTPPLQNNTSKILFRPLRQLQPPLRHPPFCLLLSRFPLRGLNRLPFMTTGCRPTNYPPPTLLQRLTYTEIRGPPRAPKPI